MAGPEDPLSGLPDILRESNRPIIIYQGGPPPAYADTRTSNALGVLFWMAMITICLGVAGFCAWSVWSPTNDAAKFSPIYADGRPNGLMKQIEERRAVSDWADNLYAFRDSVQSMNTLNRVSDATHPLVGDRPGIGGQDGGVDALRREWDAMCATIRARIYDRRVGLVDQRAAELRQQRTLAADDAARRVIDDELAVLRAQRLAILEQRRTDADPALRCAPAATAAVCAPSDDQPWCNPEIAHPEEFTEER